MESYQEFVTRKRAEYGDKFSDADLAPRFRPYFESGARIEVDFGYGTVKRGRVGVTSGWRPTFLLMLRRSDRGSNWVLGQLDTIVRVVSA